MSLTAAQGPVRVMLADDSAVIRGLVAKWIDAEPELTLVATAVNGRDAVRLAKEHLPEVIILDIEMPQMNGLEALPELLRAAPKAKVLMSSTLTRRGAEVTLKALTLGAADYVTKPETGQAAAATFRRELMDKARALGPRRVRPSLAMAPAARPAAPLLNTKLKAPPRIDALLIGSSTGGPQALRTLLPEIAGKLKAPILIAQHMPSLFTTILAQHLAQATRMNVVEPRDGAALTPSTIFVAPGDHHMRVTAKYGAPRIELDQSPPVNFCRPAVDPLFMSAAEAYGANVLAVVLTGMGSDGKRGAESIVGKGGAVLAQDEASSVVWGMPGAVAQANLALGVHPIKDMAGAILALAQARRI